LRDVIENHTATVATSSPGAPEGTVTYVPDPYYINGSYLSIARGRDDVTRGFPPAPTTYRAYKVDTHVSQIEMSYDQWIYGYWNFISSSTGKLYTKRMWTRRSYSGSRGLTDAMSKLGMTATYYPSISLNLLNEARTKALNAASDGKLNLGETLGDIRQSGHMIANRLGMLAKALNAARKGDIKGVAAALGVQKIVPRNRKQHSYVLSDASRLWLEYQFGWLPIMSDIFNLVEGVNEAFNRGPYITVEGLAVADSHPGIFMAYTVDGTLQQGVQVGLTYKISDATRAGLNQIGLLNPMQLAWELRPLSFVVDWFISVSDYLEALQAPMGLSFQCGYETTFTRGDYTVETKTFFGNSSYEQLCKHKVTNFAMSRSGYAGSPPPGLYMKSGLNFSKAVTAVALLSRR